MEKSPDRWSLRQALGARPPGVRQGHHRPPLPGLLLGLGFALLAASVTGEWQFDEVGSDALVDEDAAWDAVGEFPGAERQSAIMAALSLGLNTTSISRENCVWRRGSELNAVCPDEDMGVYLYNSSDSRQRINVSEADALRSAGWDIDQHTVVLVHGYGGGQEQLPMNILRDAYLAAGGFNVLVLDWSRLSRLPCYPAAVHNAVLAARCVGGVARLLRDSGARGNSWTCVGHSLGAHVCGIMADTVMFRVHKIIGLDPARPLIRPQNKHRLDAGDASVVHVMHTNAGYYGETGAIGTADFCMNGGRTQPHCSAAKNVNLCSHLSSVCFLADSIDRQSPLVAEPCGRRCPSARRAQSDATKQRLGFPASLGQHTPDSASGTFCASSTYEPFCQREPGGRGHPLCCLPRHNTNTSVTDDPVTSTTASQVAHEAPPVTTESPSTASTVATEGTDQFIQRTTLPYKVGATITTEAPVTKHWERVEIYNSSGHTAVTAPMPASVADHRPRGSSEVEVTVSASQEITNTGMNFDTIETTELSSTTNMSPPEPTGLSGIEQKVHQSDLTLIATAAQPESTLSPSQYLISTLGLFPSPSQATSPPLSNPITFPDTSLADDVSPSIPQTTANEQTLATMSVKAVNRWTPQFPSSSRVHIVMPSNDSLMFPSLDQATTEGNVYAIYSTNAPPPAGPGPLVVVMANSGLNYNPFENSIDNIRENLIENSSPFELPTTPVMDQTPFRPVSPGAAVDEAMAAMTEMTPPPLDPMFATFPFASPSSSPPPPEPASPEDPAVIPAAGSPTGAWIPMVMLPPTPFSVDSWKLRYRIPRPHPMRRTTYRNYVYER